MKNLETQVATLVPSAVTIESADDMTKAAEQLVELKTLLKNIEAEEAKIVKPAYAAYKAALAQYKPLKDKVNQGIKWFKDGMTKYQTEEAKKAAIAKEKIADRMVRGTLKPETAVAKLEKVDTPETRVGDVTFVTEYEIAIEDITKVPFEYLKVELKRAEVKKVAKEGKNIPGLIITEIKVPRKV